MIWYVKSLAFFPKPSTPYICQAWSLASAIFSSIHKWGCFLQLCMIHTSSAAWDTRQITSYTDDKSAAEPGNSVGPPSGASDVMSAGDATEHNCGVAAMHRNNPTFDNVIIYCNFMLSLTVQAQSDSYDSRAFFG